MLKGIDCYLAPWIENSCSNRNSSNAEQTLIFTKWFCMFYSDLLVNKWFGVEFTNSPAKWFWPSFTNRSSYTRSRFLFRWCLAQKLLSYGHGRSYGPQTVIRSSDGHGRGMDTKFLGKRGVHVGSDTEFLENCGVESTVDIDTNTTWNRCPPNSVRHHLQTTSNVASIVLIGASGSQSRGAWL